MEICVEFSRPFLEKFTKNSSASSNNCREKLQRNTEKILEIFGELLKICSQAL